MEKTLEQLAIEQREKAANVVEYIKSLDLDHASQQKLKELLFLYEDNARGRRIFGMEQDPENEIIIDAIKNARCRDGGAKYINGCIHGYVKP